MVLKVVTMAELRLDVLTEPLRTGETVADVCRRYGISRDTYYRYRRRYLAEGLDVGAVEAPTLILTSRNPSLDFLGESRKLAAGIPNSQLRIVDGTFAPYVADRVAVLDAIENLLGGKAEADDSTDVLGFRTIVFTDIVGSTEFVRRVGDKEGRAAVRELEQQVASLAADHGGRVVKNLGDGSLVSFGSNSSAISFGLAVQDKFQGETPPTPGGDGSRRTDPRRRRHSRHRGRPSKPNRRSRRRWRNNCLR